MASDEWVPRPWFSALCPEIVSSIDEEQRFRPSQTTGHFILLTAMGIESKELKDLVLGNPESFEIMDNPHNRSETNLWVKDDNAMTLFKLKFSESFHH